jgi:PKD repeat protein
VQITPANPEADYNYVYTANGAQPSVASVPDPTFTYGSPGTYQIIQKVSNAAGSSTDTLQVVVGASPDAAFEATVVLGSLSLDLTNDSEDADGFTWHFGDGNSSTEAEPSHTYAADGAYTILLIANSACGTDTAQQTVNVITAPMAGFELNATTGCAPFTVSLINTASTNAADFSYLAPGATPEQSTDAEPSFTYGSPGTYEIIQTVSNAAGSNSDTLQVTVGGIPVADFEASTTPGSFELNISDNSSDASAYLWSFGDGNESTVSNPAHAYAEDGVYTVQLIVSNQCGNDTTTQEVEIVTAPTAGFTTEQTEGCAPFTLTLNNTASANATDFTYTATGAVPPVSSNPNPTFTFPAAGQYTIIQIVSNAAGSSTDTLTISVGVAPDAEFEGIVTLGTTLLELTNNTLGATNFAWDFGDGNTSTASAPSHTYTADGTYQVTLIASNACGADTVAQSFTVVTPPVAAIDLEMSSGCLPFTVNPVSVASANAEELLWTAPGAAPETATGAMPAFTYTEAGTYTIYLEASNAAGVSIDSTIIEVKGLPDPVFSAEVDGFTVNLANASTSALTFAWSFGDGNNSDAANPAHTYESPGDYDITLTAANECGQADTTLSVSIVLPPPTAGFEVESTSGCAPFEVTFVNTSQFGESFEWVLPGGTPATATTANPVVVYETPGVFSATLIVNNTSGSDTIELPDLITVGAGPQAGFDFSIDQATVSFVNTAINADVFLWSFGDGSTSTDLNPVHDYDMAGVFDVTLIAENICGTDTLQQTIEIEGQAPEATISFGNTAGACAPQTLELLASSSEGAPADSWQWLLPGGAPETATGETVAVTYDEAGTYSITLIGVNAFGADTLTLTDTIQLDEVPVAGFDYETQEGDVAFTNTSTGTNLFFQWDFGDGSTSTEASPNHSYTETGQYNVILTVGNSCDTFTVSQVLNIMVSSTGDWADLSAFEVFPNPNRGLFTVEVTAAPAEAIQCQLYNLMGQQLKAYEADFRSGYWQQNIDGTALPAGVYLLELRIGQQRAYRRVVVE